MTKKTQFKLIILLLLFLLVESAIEERFYWVRLMFNGPKPWQVGISSM